LRRWGKEVETTNHCSARSKKPVDLINKQIFSGRDFYRDLFFAVYRASTFSTQRNIYGEKEFGSP